MVTERSRGDHELLISLLVTLVLLDQSGHLDYARWPVIS